MKKTEDRTSIAVASSTRPTPPTLASAATRSKPAAPIAVPPHEATRFRAAPAFELSATDMPSRDDIRERAYFLYLARNGGPGDAESDWLQAERELIAERSKLPARRLDVRSR